MLSYFAKIDKEIDTVEITSEDFPQEYADDNDTLLRHNLPMDLRKLFVLKERSIRNLKEVIVKIDSLRWQIFDVAGNIIPGTSMEAINNLHQLGKAACLLKPRNDLLSGVFDLALWDYFKMEGYKLKVCANWGVVLCGEEEHKNG